MTRRIRVAAPLVLLVALGLVAPAGGAAQEPVPESVVRRPVPAVPQDSAAGTAAPELPSPGGAFLRSLLVPGWGQATYGAYIRGGVFFTAQAGSWFMLLKTMAKLDEARQIEAGHIGGLRDSLLAAAATDTMLARRYAEHPDSLAVDLLAAADSSQAVLHTRGLIDSREQQREDWIAWTIFWTLASGVDAFVNAHLSDFPAEVTAEPRPGGGLSVGVRVPAPGSP